MVKIYFMKDKKRVTDSKKEDDIRFFFSLHYIYDCIFWDAISSKGIYNDC